MATYMCENKQLLFSSSHCAKTSPVKWVKWVRYSVTPYRLFGRVSWFTVEFHRKLFQLACPSPGEEGDTGSFLYTAFTYNSCAYSYGGCSPFPSAFPNVKEDEQFGGKRVTPGLS